MKKVSAVNRASNQQGVVLFVALIVLVIMALTGIAMIRQSGTGLSIAGNAGFRQNAVSGADLGTERAVVWIRANITGNVLDNDNTAIGYFSDWGNADARRKAGDPTAYDWSLSQLAAADDGTGNQVNYVIERLCLNPNASKDAVNQHCVQTEVTEGSDKSGTCDNYPKSCPPPPKFVQYRVSSRVLGPRNTVSYIQVMLSYKG